MNLIACVDSNWGIGKNGDLLVHIPEDLKYFKKNTVDKIVICGRKTYESFPTKPLPNREHLVLTSDPNFGKGIDHVIGVSSFHELKKILNLMNDLDNVYIIGGASLYNEMINWEDVSLALITKVYHHYEADTFFPNLDKIPSWRNVNNGKIQEYNGIKFNFNIYQKIYN